MILKTMEPCKCYTPDGELVYDLWLEEQKANENSESSGGNTTDDTSDAVSKDDTNGNIAELTNEDANIVNKDNDSSGGSALRWTVIFTISCVVTVIWCNTL